MLVPGSLTFEALTRRGGILQYLAKDSTKTLGGFIHVPETQVGAPDSLYGGDEEPFHQLVNIAVSRFEEHITTWEPPETAIVMEAKG